MNSCPICQLGSIEVVINNGTANVQCHRCGQFLIDTSALASLEEWQLGNQPAFPKRGRYAASHAIRRAQGHSRQLMYIDLSLLKKFWSSPLPTAGRQAELFILELGKADLSVGGYLLWRQERWCASIGTEDNGSERLPRGLEFIKRHLYDMGLIASTLPNQDEIRGFRLTFSGWTQYEKLQHEVIESKTAFMAMSFTNSVLSKIVVEYFVPAVRETGFQLHRLDDRAKAGLIDNRMRVEIRASKFLVCDLTDENRGAYWEAGFAEGVGRPVFYTCEAKKFDKDKTHFDTEHFFTIKWDANHPEIAAADLKNAIRNEFPINAIQPDFSDGRRA